MPAPALSQSVSKAYDDRQKWIDMLIDKEFQERMRNDPAVQACDRMLRDLEINKDLGQSTDAM